MFNSASYILTTHGRSLGKMPIFTRREGKLSTEVSGHVANTPFLLIGSCTLDEDNIS